MANDSVRRTHSTHPEVPVKKQMAATIAASVLILGGSAAFALDGSGGPSPSVDTTTTAAGDTTTTIADTTTTVADTTSTTVADTTSTTVPDTTSTTVADTTSTTVGATGDTTSTTAPRNHGEVVSNAAHDHSMDETCGNHGKAVSAVARGTTCDGANSSDSSGDTTDTTDTTVAPTTTTHGHGHH